MAVHIIPIKKLSARALRGVIEEFISREGTDYGAVEVAPETKFRQVWEKLAGSLAVLVYDDETETTNILMKDDPLLAKLDRPNE
ncbi:MAG: YheU family protein [Deltaproteobacteria bacterium]|nr:YheU family protein [Deltaproteobacteria bacterium]